MNNKCGRVMKIKKLLLTSLLISSLFCITDSVKAQMTPEASLLYQQACSAEHQQDLKEAITKLEQAIQISQNDAMLLTKLAGLYSEIDETDKAIDTYKKVISIKPDDSFVYISLGSLYESQSKYKEALECYQKSLDILPEYKYNYYNIANAQYQLKDYKNAVQNYQAFLDTYSQHSEARENLASSYFILKDYKNAEENYTKLYDKDPSAFKDYAEYGISLLNTNNSEKAADILETAIANNPDNDSAHLGLAQAYQDLGKNDQSYEQYQIVLAHVPNLNTVRLDYANLLAAMDKNTEAINQYTQYIKAYPNDINGYLNIAKTYKKLGNNDKALENYLIVEKKSPDNIDIQKEIALCYHTRKDYESAIKYYDKILNKQPEEYNAKYNKALALHALNKYEDAISLYNELLTIKDDKNIKNNLNNALVSRGHELIAIEDYEKAMDDFKLALRNGYTGGYVYYGMAKIYRAQENNTKASDYYEKAISLEPDKTEYSNEYKDFISSLYSQKVKVNPQAEKNDNTIALINVKQIEEPQSKTTNKEEKLNPTAKNSPSIKQNEELISAGDNDMQNKNYDNAIKNYQSALLIVPNDAETLLKLGNIYKIKEDNTKAINYYQKAIIVNPEYADGWFYLGVAYANENNPIEAQKSFEKVISLDSNYNSGSAYYTLGKVLEYQGKKDEAVKNYKLFIKHSNNKELINSVQEQIKAIK